MKTKFTGGSGLIPPMTSNWLLIPRIQLALSLSLLKYIYLSLFIYLFLPLFFSLSLYLSIFLSFYLSLSLYIYIYLYISLFPIFLSLYLSFSLSKAATIVSNRARSWWVRFLTRNRFLSTTSIRPINVT